VQGKVTRRKKGGTSYINYEYGRVYDPEKRYNTPLRSTNGKQDETDDTKMCPNQNFLQYFPNRSNQAVQDAFPQDVTGSKQYGPNIKNFAVLLKNIGFVSYKRMSKLCSALGLDLSTGTLLDICNRFADKCKDVRPMITSLLQSSLSLGLDETGGNIKGSKIWHHTTVSEDATPIVAHKNRGEKGTLSSGVMQNFTGTVCHDFWSSYFKWRT